MVGIRGERRINDDGEVILTGALKSAASIIKKHGDNFYREIGRKGGSVSCRKGFATMSKKKIAECGRKGGISKTLKAKKIKEAQ